jgi:hypothetical protein
MISESALRSLIQKTESAFRHIIDAPRASVGEDPYLAISQVQLRSKLEAFYTCLGKPMPKYQMNSCEEVSR